MSHSALRPPRGPAEPRALGLYVESRRRAADDADRVWAGALHAGAAVHARARFRRLGNQRLDAGLIPQALRAVTPSPASSRTSFHIPRTGAPLSSSVMPGVCAVVRERVSAS